jgi:2-C-methyl-D-erythritol 4-phosphate cytidylyltransferase
MKHSKRKDKTNIEIENSQKLPEPATIGAIIPSAGLSIRLPGCTKKQFRYLNGKPIVLHALERLISYRMLKYISLVLPENELDSVVIPNNSYVDLKVVSGGLDRKSSVENGLKILPEEVKWVVIHDGVRPFLTKDLVKRCLLESYHTGASLAAFKISDTLKLSDEKKFTLQTISRKNVWSAQTPQVVRRELLEKAYKEFQEHNSEITDESSLLEKIGVKSRIVISNKMNIKITTQEDLLLAEFYLKQEKNLN